MTARTTVSVRNLRKISMIFCHRCENASDGAVFLILEQERKQTTLQHRSKKKKKKRSKKWVLRSLSPETLQSMLRWASTTSCVSLLLEIGRLSSQLTHGMDLHNTREILDDFPGLENRRRTSSISMTSKTVTSRRKPTTEHPIYVVRVFAKKSDN